MRTQGSHKGAKGSNAEHSLSSSGIGAAYMAHTEVRDVKPIKGDIQQPSPTVCILNIVSLILAIVFPNNLLYTAATLVAQTAYTNSFVVARGESVEVNLNTGIVLGTNAASKTVINDVESKLTPMTFAAGSSPAPWTEAETGHSGANSTFIQLNDLKSKMGSETLQEAAEEPAAKLTVASLAAE
ncbi:hypothetical protein NUW54_g1764 [Trametes sanguinea]|uniref:Uncharacterized protein n=1 Tax=Trametes sanguinea TaxID=158606 RepID=A0ACC1Q7V7_9APHY|nr:hypothetical protein NUW54_g1764 [Trametes sanguinea]